VSYLNEIERRLDLPVAVRQQVMRELASHFTELKAELVESGMEPPQAEREAEKRLGEPSDVAARLNAAHNSASWKSALLCAVPFVIPAIRFLLPAGGFRTAASYALALFIFAVALRELIKGRRPVWLTTWLAGACFLAFSVGADAITYLWTHTPLSLNTPPLWQVVYAFPALIVAWRVPRLRSMGLATAVMLVLSSSHVYEAGAATHYGLVVGGAISWLLLAVMVFQMHPYGSPNLASFFIMALFARGYLSHEPLTGVGYLLVGLVLYALPMVWVARAPRREDKAFAILTTMVVWMLVMMGRSVLGPGGIAASRVLLPTVRTALISYVTVMFPIWLEVRRNRKNRSAIVR